MILLLGSLRVNRVKYYLQPARLAATEQHVGDYLRVCLGHY